MTPSGEMALFPGLHWGFVAWLLGKVAVSVIFGGGGVFMLRSGWRQLARARRFLAHAVSTPGVVVSYEAVLHRMEHEKKGPDSEYMRWHPVVEFLDNIGVAHRATIPFGTVDKAFAEGAEVTLLYDREDPGHPQIQGFGNIKSNPLAVMAGGACFLLLVLAVWVFDVPVTFSVR